MPAYSSLTLDINAANIGTKRFIMKKSFKNLTLVLIIALTLLVMVMPVSADQPEPGAVAAWLAEGEFGEPPPWASASSLPARCGSSC